MAVRPDLGILITVAKDAWMVAWDLATAEPLQTFQSHTNQITGMASVLLSEEDYAPFQRVQDAVAAMNRRNTAQNLSRLRNPVPTDSPPVESQATKPDPKAKAKDKNKDKQPSAFARRKSYDPGSPRGRKTSVSSQEGTADRRPSAVGLPPRSRRPSVGPLSPEPKGKVTPPGLATPSEPSSPAPEAEEEIFPPPNSPQQEFKRWLVNNRRASHTPEPSSEVAAGFFGSLIPPPGIVTVSLDKTAHWFIPDTVKTIFKIE
eukprot:NODE_3987_length_854_cov_9.608696_g3305_i0.p1 GENE.NODE_3987_length_854_cov_9.608696_g3305_i0~~NODE_3987_length_854_cov_9.608696_g3305_i0.p1  ORF type:complete len:267 (+),score=43.89 NODE_3987_length_854_cov_9.608696_g3305_i0:23-802(+)